MQKKKKEQPEERLFFLMRKSGHLKQVLCIVPYKRPHAIIKMRKVHKTKMDCAEKNVSRCIRRKR